LREHDVIAQFGISNEKDPVTWASRLELPNEVRFILRSDGATWGLSFVSAIRPAFGKPNTDFWLTKKTFKLSYYPR
jgi:hypothetical protein